MIQVRNLTKSFGPLVAVNDISFDVERGGVVGFLGPNGAGKTTTIRILTCYHPATSGSATIAGFDVFRDSIAVRRRIGYLPESTPLYPEMRVREYLDFRGKLRGMSRQDRTTAVRRATERCWLGEFIERPIGQLSKGMRQRVGLADAILHEPEVLVLDEPTIGLDPNQIRETRNLIKELGEQHTVLLSSHILHEVEQACSHALIIASGKIVASGSPKELRDRFSSQGQVIAEIQAPPEDVEKAASNIPQVQGAKASSVDGWTHLAVTPKPDADVRADIFRMAADKSWLLREIHREGATLEDFFVQVTARQQDEQRERVAGR